MTELVHPDRLAKLEKIRILPYAEADREAARDPRQRIPDISKARRILGYNPTISLDEGLRELYWMETRKLLANLTA